MSSEISFSRLLKIALVFASGGLWLAAGACSTDSGDDPAVGGQGGVATNIGGVAGAVGGSSGIATNPVGAGGATAPTSAAAGGSTAAACVPYHCATISCSSCHVPACTCESQDVNCLDKAATTAPAGC